MSTVTLQEFERDSLALIGRVEAGEPLTILRGGQPIAEVRPVRATHAASRPHGLAAGLFSVPDDFDAPMPEDVVRAFEGQ